MTDQGTAVGFAKEARDLLEIRYPHAEKVVGPFEYSQARRLVSGLPPTQSRSLPDLDTLTRKVAAWAQAHNADPRPVSWRFTTPEARIKLKHIYPSIQDG